MAAAYASLLAGAGRTSLAGSLNTTGVSANAITVSLSSGIGSLDESTSFDPQAPVTAFQDAAASGPSQPQAPLPEPSPTPTPQPLDRKALCQPSEASALYCIYTVQPGDTLSAIALDLGLRGTDGLPAAELLAQSNKPDVKRSDEIVAGQKLRVPVVSGIIHTVFDQETLAEVAQGYGVDATTIKALGVNQIADPSALTVGQEIIVPDPTRLPVQAAPAPPAAASPTPSPTEEASPTATPTPIDTTTPEATATPESTSTSTPAPSATATARATSTARAGSTRTPTPKAVAPAGAPAFIWPATGPISSYFGPSHPLGIDIDLFNDPNQAIKAAAAGTVTFAGGDPCCSYGLYVIIDHGNGYTTLYAHLSQIKVSVGQKITQGQVIGIAGRSGYATGNHLHFEVRKDGQVLDPLLFLP